jgi:hypothetical protein
MKRSLAAHALIKIPGLSGERLSDVSISIYRVPKGAEAIARLWVEFLKKMQKKPGG